MPEITDGSYLTKKGINLIAKLLAAQGPLTFTRASIGKGTVPADTTPQNMIALFDFVMDVPITRCDNPHNGEACVVVQAMSLGVDVGFFASELALWANDPDEGEVLYCYVSFAEKPEWIRPNGAPVSTLATFSIYAIVSSVQIVTALIPPDTLVTREDLVDYAKVNHTHVIADVTGLQAVLDAHQTDISAMKDILSGDAVVMPDDIDGMVLEISRTQVTVGMDGWSEDTEGMYRKQIPVVDARASRDVHVSVQGGQIGKVPLVQAIPKNGAVELICASVPEEAFEATILIRDVYRREP